MAWEIEEEHVDLAEGVHRYTFINRDVITRDGHPARHKFYISLGEGHDGDSCPHCHSKLNRKHTLKHDGTLHHAEHGEKNPHDMAKDHLGKLNAFHDRMHAYIRKHKANHYKGPKK